VEAIVLEAVVAVEAVVLEAVVTVEAVVFGGVNAVVNAVVVTVVVAVAANQRERQNGERGGSESQVLLHKKTPWRVCPWDGLPLLLRQYQHCLHAKPDRAARWHQTGPVGHPTSGRAPATCPTGLPVLSGRAWRGCTP